MRKFSLLGVCLFLSLLFGCTRGSLPPGCVRGDVVSHSYVPNKAWTQEEGLGICPYLMEYGMMTHRSEDVPLEDFHDENIRRIDLASRWSTVIMLYPREDMFRDELINLMIRCYHNRQLIELGNSWHPDDPNPYANTIHILEKLWENRNRTLTSPEGDQATGRQLINNILMVSLGDEGLRIYGTEGIEKAHEAFKTRIKYRTMNGEQPFRHIKSWYNMIGYRVGNYAASQRDIDEYKRLKIPSNCEFIGTDVYHYWSWQWGPPEDPDTMWKQEIWERAEAWQNIITRYYPKGLKMRIGNEWVPETSNETHAMMGAIDLAGAKDAMMFYIANSSGLPGGAYTTPIITMDAFYKRIKVGPWVGLSWWVWGEYVNHCATMAYVDKTLYHYTKDNRKGEPYSDEKLDEYHDEFVASRLRMFNDVVYRQFGDLNPIENKPGEVNLGISLDGRFFTLDGEPTFLQGLSYYGAGSIADPEKMIADLDDMAAQGFNWIRVWAYWQYNNGDEKGEDVSVLTHDGKVRPMYMTRLKRLLTECNRRGIVVDVSIPFDGEGKWVGPRNPADHLAAVRTLATELKPWRNVYFDIANERDVGDARFVSSEQVGRLIDAVKVVDSLRLCTASCVPGSADDMLKFLRIAKMDFITPHLGREKGSAAKTIARVGDMIGWMNEIGWRVPVHLQEPFRRGYTNYNPVVEDYLRDCANAKIAEAAGWCLHNGSSRETEDGHPWRSFLMDSTAGRLYDQWDPIEREATERLSHFIGGPDLNLRRYQAEFAEQLAHQIGRREGDAWVAGAGEKGYMTFGPNIKTVPAGDHTAIWRLKIEGEIPADMPLFTIDVIAEEGRRVLATREILRGDFKQTGQWVEFELPFVSIKGDSLELRTYWDGHGRGAVDWITLEIRPVSGK